MDLEQELQLLERGIEPRPRIPFAEHRVAVFTYEDPDGSGLGNALAALVGGEILFRAQVRSLGVLRYEGRLGPMEPQALSYFDKVEKVTRAQQVTVSVWGVIRDEGERFVVDTFVQLAPVVWEKSFAWSIVLPRRMGGGILRARCRPDRIQVQRLAVPKADVGAVKTAAQQLDELRESPRNDAPVAARIPTGTMYRIDRHEGEWVHVQAGAGRAGWVKAEGHCQGTCAPLLDAGRFTGGLIRFIETARVPPAGESLAPDAQAVVDQINVLGRLRSRLASKVLAGLRPDAAYRLPPPPSDWGWLVDRWLEGRGVPPGGASFANIRMLDRVTEALARAAHKSGEEHGPVPTYMYDQLAPSRDEVRTIAFDLAQASLDDPRNPEVLQNLAVLFAYAGEGERARLANELANQSEAPAQSAVGAGAASRTSHGPPKR
jgi:hypothetical protein